MEERCYLCISCGKLDIFPVTSIFLEILALQGLHLSGRCLVKPCPSLLSVHFLISHIVWRSCLILKRTEPVGWGKQVACPETGPILLSPIVTPPPSPIHTHKPLLGSGPEATGLRLEVIFPTEPAVTPHISTESCRHLVKTSFKNICYYCLLAVPNMQDFHKNVRKSLHNDNEVFELHLSAVYTCVGG